MGDALTIGDVAAPSGVAPSALRFYESTGLIASERTVSGHRRYPRSVLRRVAFIVFAQKVGLSLREVRAELTRLPRNRAPDRADWAKLSARWTKRIDERIAALQRTKAGLTECIGCGCLSLDRCRYANPVYPCRLSPRSRSPRIDPSAAAGVAPLRDAPWALAGPRDRFFARRPRRRGPRSLPQCVDHPPSRRGERPCAAAQIEFVQDTRALLAPERNRRINRRRPPRRHGAGE